MDNEVVDRVENKKGEPQGNGWTTYFYWSSTFAILASLFLIISGLEFEGFGIGFSKISLKDDQHFIEGLFLLIAAFHGFFVGFLVKLLTDIRYYLRGMCQNSQDAS